MSPSEPSWSSSSPNFAPCNLAVAGQSLASELISRLLKWGGVACVIEYPSRQYNPTLDNGVFGIQWASISPGVFHRKTVVLRGQRSGQHLSRLSIVRCLPCKPELTAPATNTEEKEGTMVYPLMLPKGLAMTRVADTCVCITISKYACIMQDGARGRRPAGKGELKRKDQDLDIRHENESRHKPHHFPNRHKSHHFPTSNHITIPWKSHSGV